MFDCRMHFDVVVAGGGSAGCALAARLSENPDCAVCLVEAGPDYVIPRANTNLTVVAVAERLAALLDRSG